MTSFLKSRPSIMSAAASVASASCTAAVPVATASASRTAASVVSSNASATNETHDSHKLQICYSLLCIAVERKFFQNIYVDDTTPFFQYGVMENETTETSTSGCGGWQKLLFSIPG